MTFHLVVLPEVENEALKASNWYDGEAKGLGSRFLRAFYASLRKIRRNPRIFQIVEEDYRRGFVGTFPYAVFYFLEEELVIVAALFHSSRDPEILRQILKARKGPQ